MEEIIAPISKEIIKAELSEDKRLRFTKMCIRDRCSTPLKSPKASRMHSLRIPARLAEIPAAMELKLSLIHI